MKKYEQIYNYFTDQMKNGRLKPNDRMPSLRECESTIGFSRTSVETAYMLLAADGYIYAEEKKGFFVTELAERVSESNVNAIGQGTLRAFDREIKYDFATIKEDTKVSCLGLWRRYMKSALRQENRLLSYADYQGEADLRKEIASYVRKTRNIICNTEDIVIGAGFQNLLHILIPLMDGEKTVSFPTKDFMDGARAFSDAGYEVSYRNKACHIIYVTPAYMTKWGEVMTMRRRHEITEHAIVNNHILIEDDYQNEFVFDTKPTPSLYAMTGGENVAYLGSFSRILLPSVRISFLILPRGYAAKYQMVREYYNQTASKAEQIALTQFLRDGQLNRHIKKMRRLYAEKRTLFIKELKNKFDENTTILVGDSGMEIGLKLCVPNKNLSYDDIKSHLADNGVNLSIVSNSEGKITFLLSCSGIDVELIADGIERLRESLGQLTVAN